MSEKSNKFLEVKDLVVEYQSDGQTVHAVNGVSFHLDHGKTLGLVGETGAGKTTIAKSILRILPDVGCKVTGGEIHLEEQELLTLHENEMRKIRGNKISMIFQDPMTALNPVQKVGDQIAEVVRLHNDNHVNPEERAKEMLETVGIPAERYSEYPHQFSGGMKQRVVIAIALATGCDHSGTGVGSDCRSAQEVQHLDAADHPRSGRCGAGLRRSGHHLRRKHRRVRHQGADL